MQIENPAPAAQLFLHFPLSSSELGFVFFECFSSLMDYSLRLPICRQARDPKSVRACKPVPPFGGIENPHPAMRDDMFLSPPKSQTSLDFSGDKKIHAVLRGFSE